MEVPTFYPSSGNLSDECIVGLEGLEDIEEGRLEVFPERVPP